jgi:hypothetical protein
MIIIVPLIASFALDTISFLASILDPVVCIYVVNGGVQVPFVSIPTALTRR